MPRKHEPKQQSEKRIHTSKVDKDHLTYITCAIFVETQITLFPATIM